MRASAIAVSNGTVALVLALAEMGLPPRSFVHTTPFSFIATASAIAASELRPSFSDISLATYNLDDDFVEPALPEGASALLPVHLYGQCAEMEPIIQQLDSEEAAAGEVRVVSLLYSDASEMNKALQETLKKEGAGARGQELVGGVRAEQTNAEGEGVLSDPTLNYQRDAQGRILRAANGSPLLIVPTTNALGVSKLTYLDRAARSEKEYLR